MQTFLPYRSFVRSAFVLDPKRLSNQRNEAMIILKTLLGMYEEGKGWPNHPATLMWKGYEYALARYGYHMSWVAHRRGIGGQQGTWFINILAKLIKENYPKIAPPWLGDLKFHKSHQSQLVQKDTSYYQAKFPNVADNLPYFWPTKEGYNNGKSIR